MKVEVFSSKERGRPHLQRIEGFENGECEGMWGEKIIGMTVWRKIVKKVKA